MKNLGVGKLLLVLLGFAVALISRPDGTVAAQGQILLLDNSAELQFPDTITFRLSAQAPAEIESISLTYGTNARSCQGGGSRQRVDFEPGSEVDTQWEWELKRSGSVPPGSQVWWTWTIEDADGNSFISEREELLVDDDRHDWRTIERDGVTVNWYSGDDAFGEQTLSAAVDELERLRSEIGVDVSEAVQLWVYPTATEVREALVISADWTGAVAFPDYYIMIISLAPGQSEWAAEVIPHELTHLVVGMASHNCKGGYLPVWLSEGLAVYGEGAIDSPAVAQLEEALQEERLQSLRSLGDGFSAYGSGARMAYTHSGEVVRFMLEQYGPQQMDALLTAIADGLAIDQALEQVYDFDTDELDARWRQALGYTATPTSAAAEALKKATPTLVPTLALVGPPVVSIPTVTAQPATATPQPSPTVAETATAAEPTDTATTGPLAEAPATQPVESISASTVEPAGETDESGANPLLWLAIIGAGAVAVLIFAYIVLRKGE